MNWRSSLTAAVLVAAAGLLVGFAVGGKKTTTTRTDTVTVAHTVTQTAPGPSANHSTSSSTSTSQSKPATAGGSSGGSSQQYYAEYLSSQDSGQLNNNATNTSLDDNPSSLQLNGQSYARAVAFDLGSNSDHPVTESFQLPVPGFKHFSTPVAGLATNNSAKATYKLTVYKNNDNPGATVLYTGTFSGPSGTHPISFDTQGATDVVLDWGEPSSGEPDGTDQFILADPTVSR